MADYTNVDNSTFSYVDNRITGETIIYKLSSQSDFTIKVKLYVDGREFPVDPLLTAKCCFAENRFDDNSPRITVDCLISESGEIIIPIPASLRVSGKNLFGEIIINGTDSSGESFIYRASNFRLSIIE